MSLTHWCLQKKIWYTLLSLLREVTLIEDEQNYNLDSKKTNKELLGKNKKKTLP